MLRPIEFDSTADPRSGKSDQRRFNHFVIVNKIIIIGFIERSLDSSSQFGENHDEQIVIFKENRLIFLIDFFI